MKICAAQTRPVKGDIQKNIEQHKQLIDIAVSGRADIIIFPELSLTGYEPTLAGALALRQDDSRLNDFQDISNNRQITIGVGIPAINGAGTCISMVLFQPRKKRQLYSKKYLHLDEERFFTAGQNLSCLKIKKTNIALVICYELSVLEHAEKAFKNGAEIYIASVAKSAIGIENAVKTLSRIASQYSMTVLMSNCVGYCDDFESAGNTSAWNSKGELGGQLNDTDEGILIFDTDTQETSITTI